MYVAVWYAITRLGSGAGTVNRGVQSINGLDVSATSLGPYMFRSQRHAAKNPVLAALDQELAAAENRLRARGGECLQAVEIWAPSDMGICNYVGGSAATD
jgi:hypothetical protein